MPGAQRKALGEGVGWRAAWDLRCSHGSLLLSSQVLCDFPHTAAAIPPDYLLDLVPLIRPRAFSIASSLRVREEGPASRGRGDP